MRKHLLICSLLVTMVMSAQNVQLHYDLGHSLSDRLTARPSVTTTAELYKPDRWGNTFFFIDLDYFHDGVAGTYWEIAREFNVTSDKRWAAHVEYDGGMASSQLNDLSTRYQHAFLAGPAWNWASADFSKTLSYRLSTSTISRVRMLGTVRSAVFKPPLCGVFRWLIACSPSLDSSTVGTTPLSEVIG